MKSIVAIVGRPNVGKSTLFNRITKSRDAIVGNLSGITRDRKLGSVVWNGTIFTLVDTGGYIKYGLGDFSYDIFRQIEYAIESSSVIVVVLDGKVGVSPFDKDIIRLVQVTNKPILYVVNKVDGPEQEYVLSDFYSLGIEKIFPISAEYGYGVFAFLDNLVNFLSFSYIPRIISPRKKICIAILGRPNVGKSTLINYMLGEDRLIVSNIPGTTRDIIKIEVIINGIFYSIIDTAGIRKRKKISEKIEMFSVIKTLKCLNFCDIALVLLDAKKGISDQDIRIAGYANKCGCGVVFLVNKWDLVKKNDIKFLNKIKNDIKMSAKFISFAPILSLSALTGLRVSKIFKIVNNVYIQYSTRIKTGLLNRIFKDAINSNEPSIYKGKRIKFYYATQVAIKPPTIVVFVNNPEAVHFSYKRYLINRIKASSNLYEIPIRLFFRRKFDNTSLDNFYKKKRIYKVPEEMN